MRFASIAAIKKDSNSDELIVYQSSFGWPEDFKKYCIDNKDIIWAKLILFKEGIIFMEYSKMNGFLDSDWFSI